MMKKLVVLATILGGGAAFAQGTTDAVNGGEFTGLQKGTKGISVAWPTGGDPAHADFLWGLGQKTLLDLGVGVTFSKGSTTDPTTMMTTSSTAFGFDVFAGYRMYKNPSGRVRPYLEPQAHLGVGDFGKFGDTLSIGAAGVLGIDLSVTDQFTLGAGLGAGLNFADKFKTIKFGLSTASINATFWWQ